MTAVLGSNAVAQSGAMLQSGASLHSCRRSPAEEERGKSVRRGIHTCASLKYYLSLLLFTYTNAQIYRCITDWCTDQSIYKPEGSSQ